MPIRFISFFLFFIFSSSAWSVSFDWSGWTRLESYYQNSSDHNYYGSYHFILQPKIHVIDGLNIASRLDLSLLEQSHFAPSTTERQTGFVFIYGENSKSKDIGYQSLFLTLSQIYMDYKTEFLKIRMGRAPYHFGLGVNYSASQDPFQHWISVYNQVGLYMEYAPFYFYPAILHSGEESTVGAAQIGLSSENWKVSALYQHDFKKSSFVEVFGQYEQSGWEVQSSVSYAFQEGTNMTLALEAIIPLPSSKIPTQLEIYSGGAFGNTIFHPNYNTALLFWNKQMIKNDSSEINLFQISEGQIQNAVYFSPRLLFSFMDDHLKVRPLFLLARDLNEKSFNYEFDLEWLYQLDKSLFLVLKGGALYTKKLHIALLAQAAVSF